MFIEIPANKSDLSRRRLVCGVGVNDAPYKTAPTINKKTVKCPYYSKWLDMIKRCYSQSHTDKFPTYQDCSVCDEWFIFSNFKSWMEKQDWQGKELDKDIKSNGGKLYSPNNCLLVPPYINYLLINCESKKGKYLKGVSFDSRKGKYQAVCRTPKKRKFLGYFDSEQEANKAYIEFKKKLILSTAKTQPNHIRVALENYNLRGGV